MDNNYVIAVGGRGAQVVESLVYLCAMGIGPENLRVLIVDPDESNKNLSRTKELINNYKKIRKEIEKKGIGFFGTEILTGGDADTGKEHISWNCIPLRYKNLDDLFGVTEDESDSSKIKSLFYLEKELDLDLKFGFKGHPIIGATIFGRTDLQDEEMNKDSSIGKFIGDLRQKLSFGQCNLFFIGSLFGGTGAAGLPTLPNKIKAHLINQRAEVDNLKIGGVFINPYFFYAAKGMKDNELYAKSEEFLINSKAVLQNYDQLIRGIYDSVYLVGATEPFKYESFSTGGPAQNNPAHYVELFAALSSFDFFKSQRPRNNTNVYMWGREGDGQKKDDQSKKIDWACLNNDFISSNGIKEKFIKFIILYMSYKFTYKIQIDEIIKNKGFLSRFWGHKYPWQQIHFNEENDKLNNSVSEQFIKDFNNFLLGSNSSAKIGFGNWLNQIINNKVGLSIEFIKPDFETSKNISDIEIGKESRLKAEDANTEFQRILSEMKIEEGVEAHAKLLKLWFKTIDQFYSETYLNKN